MRFRSVYGLFKLMKRKTKAYQGNHEEVKRWGVSACSIFNVELLNHQQQTMTGVRSRMKISKLVTVFLPSWDPRLPRKGLPLLPSSSSFSICRRSHKPEEQLLPAAAAAQAAAAAVAAAQPCWSRLLMGVLNRHNDHHSHH